MTALLLGCSCGWVTIADTYQLASQEHACHNFDALTSGHNITREMAVSMPLDKHAVGAMRLELEALRHVDRRREHEKKVVHAFEERLKPATGVKNGLLLGGGFWIAIGFAVYELWRYTR